MENQETQVEEQVQNLPPEQTPENSPQPSSNKLEIVGVKLQGQEETAPETRAEETPAVSTEATAQPSSSEQTSASQEGAATDSDKLKELEDELSRLRAEQKQVRVEKIVPDEVKALLDNPKELSILMEDFAQRDILSLLIDKTRQENPWIKNEQSALAFLQRKYPDLDPEIPENLGLSELDYEQAKYESEGHRNALIAKQDEVKGKIKELTQTKEEQAPAFDQEAYNKLYAEKVDQGIKQFAAPALALDIPGYELPKFDLEKVREIAYSENTPLKLDGEGNLWPDMESAYKIALADYLSQIFTPTVEAAKRAAPKETAEAIAQALRGNNTQVNSPGIPGATPNGRPAANVKGVPVVGVKANF